MHKSMQTWSRHSIAVQTKHWNGEGIYTFQNKLTQPSVEFTEKGANKTKKHPESRNSVAKTLKWTTAADKQVQKISLI